MPNYYDKDSDLMQSMAYAARFARNAEQLEGRRLFPTTAIVVENNDPEYRRRIKVADPSYGGKVASNWINAFRVSENSDPPLPKVNQLVMVFYADGDPEKGYYLALMTDTNPSRAKENPVDDFSEQIDGNREVVVGGNKKDIAEGNHESFVGGYHKIAVGGDSDIKIEQDFVTRANGSIDINCGESLTLRTDSGAFVSLTAAGYAIIQDAFGRKITLGGIGNNGQWNLNNFPLEIINASDVTIAGKSVATVSAQDSRGDTLVTRGW
jgi:hypothetical protein